jgi:hypothetical protein
MPLPEISPYLAIVADVGITHVVRHDLFDDNYCIGGSIDPKDLRAL